MTHRSRQLAARAPVGFAVGIALLVGSCSAAATPEPSGYGPVTPPPGPGAFRCPAQVLAGSPPTSRLVGVRVEPQDGFDRVTFEFEPGPPDKPAAASGLIVQPVGVIPRKDATGKPLTVLGAHYLEVRFRDMALTGADGGSAFRGSRDVKPSASSVQEVVEIEESKFALDWLIGMSSDCVRVWEDGSRVVVDVQR